MNKEISESPTVSIVVVSYQTRDMTVECLRSIVRETSNVSFEVLFIDNQSDDGSFEAVEAEFGGDSRFRISRSKVNLGFAGANNHLARDAQGEFILLLNPDTVVLEGAIEKLISFARSRRGNGIWGGRTVFADGRLNPTNCWGDWSMSTLVFHAIGLVRLFPRSRLFNPRCYPEWDREGIREVAIVTGCWFLIDANLWRDLEGFDPEFFMYGEEADLCLRARAEGARPLVSGIPTIIHHGGASETTVEGKQVKLLDGEIRLLRRHWGGFRFAFALKLIETRILLRALHGYLGRCLGRSSVWIPIWERRSEWRRAVNEKMSN